MAAAAGPPWTEGEGGGSLTTEYLAHNWVLLRSAANHELCSLQILWSSY